MKQILFFTFCATLLMFTSCKVDFSPNASWKEVPVVYCIIDQDQPITYVRVQKCYLGEDNLYNYSTIYDSINYPAGALQVEMRVWRIADTADRTHRTPVRVLSFRDTVVDKQDGNFASAQGQPLFYHKNAAGDIDPRYAYELVVTKTATGQVLASAITLPIGQFDPKRWNINPSSSVGHLFNFTYRNRCEVKWYTDSLRRGRLYQPTVRYYFRYRHIDPEELQHVDYRLTRIKCADPNVSTMSTYVESASYLATLEEALAGDTNYKRFVNYVDLMLSVCNEDLYAYINSTDETGSLTQNRQVYSNIRGGVGVFAARRTGIVARVPADSSDNGPRGMHYLLQQHISNIE